MEHKETTVYPAGLPTLPLTHTLNLFLRGKVIKQQAFLPHPPTWPDAGMGKDLLLAG